MTAGLGHKKNRCQVAYDFMDDELYGVVIISGKNKCGDRRLQEFLEWVTAPKDRVIG